MRVGFIGLGTMGRAMVANVLRAGHRVRVWNRTISRTDEVVALGAERGESASDAAEGAEVVITMLADVPAVERVIAGERGVIDGLGKGSIVIDMSTVDPACARRMDKVVRQHGGVYMDAPVSGSRGPATEGKLVVLAAGPQDAIERSRAVLSTMGHVVRVGDVGQGMAMKLVLNSIGAHMMVAQAAAMVLGAKLGLDAEVMLEVLGRGAFAAPMYRAKGARMIEGNYDPDFTLALLGKDQRLVLETAKGVGYRMPTQQAVVGVIEEAVAAGVGAEDMCAMVKVFEQWAEAKVGAHRA